MLMNRFFQTMNKRSKSNIQSTVSSTHEKSNQNEKRKLRSTDKKINNEKVTDKDAAKYFITEILEPPQKVIKKKRKPVKITYKQNDESAEHQNNSQDDNEPWFPKNWEKTLNLIREMRKHHTAPVDNQGCDKCFDPEASPEVMRYQTLISLMLSSQTKDQINHAAMGRLKQHGCTLQNLANTSDDELGKLIYPVSFWRRKVQYIKKVSEILLKEYNGDIPNTIEGICALPGVGPKMGHLCMQVAWNEVTGIGVDTHVHRICNRLKWVKKHAKTPEETRKQLELWLPKNLWTEINHLFVGFGQELCLSQRPKCGQCLNNKLCPFTEKNI